MAEESFSAAWLALREGADHRSRVPSLLPRLEAAWRECGWSRILDLGSGTGSNLRVEIARPVGSVAQGSVFRAYWVSGSTSRR